MNKTIIKKWFNNLFSSSNKIENDIQIDLKTIPEPYKTFINYTIKYANDYDVRVVLTSERQVHYDDNNDAALCNGYFCGETPELAVACGQPFQQWISVFIHESSHMDQWIEQCPAWTEGLISNVEAYDLLGLWLDHHIELNEEQKYHVIRPSLYVELDCDRRALEKINEYQLPLDKHSYAQRANAYVYFYLLMGYTREWYKIGKEPYNFEEIVNAMPTHLDGNYTHLPEEYKKLMVKHMHPERYEELCS